MNGPQNYREAERLLDSYKDAVTAAEALSDNTPRLAEAKVIAISGARSLLDKAQVHATLALVAATADVAGGRHASNWGGVL